MLYIIINQYEGVQKSGENGKMDQKFLQYLS